MFLATVGLVALVLRNGSEEKHLVPWLVSVKHINVNMEEDYSEFVNGPDQIIPCNNRITWVPAGTTKIKVEG